MAESAEKINLDALYSITRNFNEIEERLGDPSVTSDPARFARLSRDRARLEPGAMLAQRYLNTVQESEKLLKQMQIEKDPELLAIMQDESARLQSEIDSMIDDLQIALLPADENDGKNVILEIRAGTGGDEAGLFARDLMRMYLRFCEHDGMTAEILDVTDTGIGGVKEAILLIKGENAWQKLHFEAGGHRVQRIPATEANGRIHTSAVTISVLPEVEDSEYQVNANDLRIDVYRASGAGGQHVNKTESAIRITHIPTGLVVTCQEEKSQHKNRDKAMAVLRARLVEKDRLEKHETQAAQKKAQVGSGDRSEKIRTYNFPQNRLTDHRIGYTSHNLEQIMEGALDDLISALIQNESSRKMAELSA